MSGANDSGQPLSYYLTPENRYTSHAFKFGVIIAEQDARIARTVTRGFKGVLYAVLHPNTELIEEERTAELISRGLHETHLDDQYNSARHVLQGRVVRVTTDEPDPSQFLVKNVLRAEYDEQVCNITSHSDIETLSSYHLFTLVMDKPVGHCPPICKIYPNTHIEVIE